MIKVFMFLWKYKILKDPANLSFHVKEFFLLSKKNQRRVLDKYFKSLDEGEEIVSFFNSKDARYIEESREVSMFDCYYFDKMLISHDIRNIRYLDKFKLDNEKIDYLINYALYIIKEEKLKIDVKEFLKNPYDLPNGLSNNINFMGYLVLIDCYNVKYLTYNDKYPNKIRELIYSAIVDARKKDFDIKNFLKSDNTLPEVLSTNIDFILYLISNDIENCVYLTSSLLNKQTISSIDQIVKTIIEALDKDNSNIEVIENNEDLSLILNKNEEFISCILDIDLDNINYVDWYNLTDNSRNKIINYFVMLLRDSGKKFNIMKYLFKDLFFQNYEFMKYLLEDDIRWIAVTKIGNKEDNDKLIDLYFRYKGNYKFKIVDFLEDGEYINHYLLENKRMFNYIFSNEPRMVKYINFLNLEKAKLVVENLVNELEKFQGDFINDDYVINGRYPIVLSNNYRFMRYVIYKNFNYLAYIDTSCIDKKELKRIINYAFRTVYYIRGEDKRLSFDIDGYFVDSMIIEDEYFKECLECL